MKNPGVCKGCKHYVSRQWTTDLKRYCNYLEHTGQSRLVIERENGGYKTDSCICYEAGKRKRRGRHHKEA